MTSFLNGLTALLKWLETYGPSIGALAMAATTYYFRWRMLVRAEQLQKANTATATAHEAVDTLVAAVEVCQAKDVKQVVTDSQNSPESQAVIDASISRKPTVSK